MALEITADADVECGECGAFVPGDAEDRNDSHDTWCERYVRTLTEHDAESETVDMLNDVYGDVTVCGYSYGAGEALRELDPVAFREEMLNYCDAHGIELV